MQEEQAQITQENKPRYHYVTCAVCGHRWYSHGTGKRNRCPACYEAKTGKKYGPRPDIMAKARAAKKQNQKVIDTKPQKKSNTIISDEALKTAKGGFLDRLLDFKLW